MIIDASISNVLHIYRLAGISESELTHAQLQERLGLQLLRSPLLELQYSSWNIQRLLHQGSYIK
jgi:hypothetical protein